MILFFCLVVLYFLLLCAFKKLFLINKIKWLILIISPVLLTYSIYIIIGGQGGLGLYKERLITDDLIAEWLLDIQENNLSSELFLEKLDERLAYAPDNVYAWVLRAQLSMAQNDYGYASVAYGQAYERYPYDLDLASQYAQSLYLANQGTLTPEAESLVHEILSVVPSDAGALNILALSRYKNEDYAEAITLWEQLLSYHKPDDGVVGDDYIGIVELLEQSKIKIKLKMVN